MGSEFDASGFSAPGRCHAAAAKAVEQVCCGRAEALMTGRLHTDELMGAVVARDAGIRTARRIGHRFVMDAPNGPQAVIISDAAVNIAPDLEAGNMLAKGLSFLAGAAAGTVLVARAPVILTSRADSLLTRLASCATAVLAATARHTKAAVAV